ncbi:MAG: xanthine dehydrogenase family protein molybdopterin-binding subunit [Thermoanaerobaculia bacterium]
MAEYAWPDASRRSQIGKRVSRVDGAAKVTGRARYTYDQNPPGLLHARMLGSPHAHAKIVSIDVSAAERMPGVKAIKIIQQPGAEVFWVGDEVVAIAAVTDGAAEDALRAVKVEYQPLPHFVDDFAEPRDVQEDTGPLTRGDLGNLLNNQVPEPQIIDAIQKKGIAFAVNESYIGALRRNEVGEEVIEALQAAKVHEPPSGPRPRYRRVTDTTVADAAAAFAQADAVSEGFYGAAVITHCCLEPHGAVASWPDASHLDFQVSTQNVSGIADQLAGPLKMQASNIHVHQEHVGGGFGSKFGPDRWGRVCAELSQLAGGAPVKLFLDRARELEVAGARPSHFARVKLGAKKDGTLLVWQSTSWGTGGPGGGGSPPLPYVFRVPVQRREHVAVSTNTGPARAWRAPSHPQAAVLTMCALEDLAAKLEMNPLDFFIKNIGLTRHPEVYTHELRKADELMGWSKRWHPRGDKTSGPVKRGLGLSIHTWGGRGHESNCDVTIHPDGAVAVSLGTQDLGTGTRTAILMVAAETLGLPITAITLNIGDNRFPSSGGSGGSTTIGGVSSSTRRAAVDALNQLLAVVAPSLSTQASELEAVNGAVRVKAAPGRSLTWKQACAKLGAKGVTARGKNPDETKPDLTNESVGGAQMADVSVDVETGVVRVEKMVAVQDCGLVINLKTAESQCYGALIMGISYALYEEKIMDPSTGRMLNPNMQFYRLAGYGDIPELVVHMMTGKGYDERGVIGLGEPPVVSPGAAISNAVANAIGVRVPVIPLTPDRVLAALEQARERGGA